LRLFRKGVSIFCFSSANPPHANLLTLLTALSDKMKYDWSDPLSIKLPARGQFHNRKGQKKGVQTRDEVSSIQLVM